MNVVEKSKKLIESYSVLHFHPYGLNFYNRRELKQIKLDCKHYMSLAQLAENCISLESVHLTNTQNITTFCQAFRGCPQLVTIETLDCSSVANSDPGFRYAFPCPKLENIKFVSETIKHSVSITSPVLSAESVKSIFDGLATVETAQTLTLHPDAKILQSQVDSANAKGWTVAGGTVVSEEEYYG